MPGLSFDSALPLLQACGVRDLRRGWRNLAAIVEKVGQERLLSWQSHLAHTADADMALNNLERFLGADDALPALDRLLAEQPESLDTLVGILATSQFLSDTLVTQPAAVTMLGLPLRHTPTRAELIDELQQSIDACFEDSGVLRTIREYRARQMLRIGTNDIFRDRPLEELTADIATVAEAAVQVALQTALRSVTRRFGAPVTASGQPGRMVVLAFGKLGGLELNYSSDIDLMILFEEEGKTTGTIEVTLEEFFSRVTTEMLRLVTAAPAAYRVDFRLRPEGKRGPLVRTLASTLAYYDTLGRTWERQALIKVRPIAGDLDLGRQFLRAIEPFVYRKYLSFAEINEIKVIKRKIEQRSSRQGESLTDVKTGFGGIRDVEFVIQFLQLLNGGDLPHVRQNNTLLAIQALLSADCLTHTEADILEKGYRFLRRTEHRLQLLSDLQTHNLPEAPEDLRRLALRLGYFDRTQAAEEQFDCDFHAITSFNRKVLNHLLHEAFPDPDPSVTPESDLILLPEPDTETVTATLGRYGFKDVTTALHNLQQLAQEPVPFLPTRRCRHFLASIAPKLLQALAETPDPDMALTNLEKVTASLGAKGVLWELFSFNQPSLKLYVELCAWSQYLSQILMSHPGMIDELLDTLVLDQPKSLDELRAELAELCRGAEPQLIERILHSFRNKELLRLGVRDILGKTQLPETLASLTDLAETVLGQIVDQEYDELCHRWGTPCVGELDTPCRFVLLGLGKFGGREMSYHSDLDLILVYEADGRTDPKRTERRPGRGKLAPQTPAEFCHYPPAESTDNFHFFSDLAQRVIKRLGHLGPYGRLYQVDMRLRPTGKSGGLATPLEGFRKYYRDGQGQIWERQSLTRARVVYGDRRFGKTVLAATHDAAYAPPWQPAMADEIVSMRKRLEASRTDRDLKRGTGGMVDVEFLVQLLLLKYAKADPSLRHPNVWQALLALRDSNILPTDDYQAIRAHYDFLRRAESRLRIVHNQSEHKLPTVSEDLTKLARRLGYESAEEFLSDLDRRTAAMRELFLAVVERERN